MRRGPSAKQMKTWQPTRARRIITESDCLRFGILENDERNKRWHAVITALPTAPVAALGQTRRVGAPTPSIMSVDANRIDRQDRDCYRSQPGDRPRDCAAAC